MDEEMLKELDRILVRLDVELSHCTTIKEKVNLIVASLTPIVRDLDDTDILDVLSMVKH